MTAPAAPPEPAGPRVTLVTRSSCQLCPPAREAVARVCAAAGERWVELRVDDDRELAAEFGDRVPVVLVDGQEVAAFAVDDDELAGAIAAGGRGA